MGHIGQTKGRRNHARSDHFGRTFRGLNFGDQIAQRSPQFCGRTFAGGVPHADHRFGVGLDFAAAHSPDAGVGGSGVDVDGVGHGGEQLTTVLLVRQQLRRQR